MRFKKAFKHYHIDDVLVSNNAPYNEIMLTNVDNFLKAIDDDTKSFKEIMNDKYNKYLENKWGKSFKKVIEEMPDEQKIKLNNELFTDENYEELVKNKIEKFSNILRSYKGINTLSHRISLMMMPVIINL